MKVTMPQVQMNNAQDLAWGAEADRSRNWRELDPRRVEGHFQLNVVQRRVALRVGVLEARKVVGRRRARRQEDYRVRLHRYDRTKPLKAGCQAQALGAVSLYPAWNGVYGKYLNSLKTANEEDSV